MSKVTDLGLNLVPSRLPKKNIVETAKAEEITSKIHAIIEEPAVIEQPEVNTVTPQPEVKPKELKKKSPKAAATPPSRLNRDVPSVKRRAARTLIEDPDAVRKTSFDFPVALYRSMKIRLAEEGVSMRDYVIGLIEDDLNNP